MAFMAGYETVCEFFGNGEGDGDDRSEIALMMQELVSPDDEMAWKRIEARLRRMTRALVRRHRVAIQRVAEALLAQGSLSKHEIDALLSLVATEGERL